MKLLFLLYFEGIVFNIIKPAKLIGATQDLFVAPEGGATLVAYQKLKERGWIDENEKVVLFR